MLWLLTGKTRTRVVEDGARIRERCPTCERETTLREVEVTKSGGVWFLEIVKRTDYAWQCTRCSNVFDLRDEPETAAAPPPARDLLTVLEAERDAAAGERARRDAAVDDELAAMKARLGK